MDCPCVDCGTNWSHYRHWYDYAEGWDRRGKMVVPAAMRNFDGSHKARRFLKLKLRRRERHAANRDTISGRERTRRGVFRYSMQPSDLDRLW